MKIKIVKVRYPTYWYKNMVGQVFVVTSDNTGTYNVLYKDSDSGYLVMKEDVEVVKETPRLYTHEGVDYILPEWANYVTCDGGTTTSLYAWENKPKQNYYNTDDAGFGLGDSSQRQQMHKYVKPLPEGAFIVKVG